MSISFCVPHDGPTHAHSESRPRGGEVLAARHAQDKDVQRILTVFVNSNQHWVDPSVFLLWYFNSIIQFINRATGNSDNYTALREIITDSLFLRSHFNSRKNALCFFMAVCQKRNTGTTDFSSFSSNFWSGLATDGKLFSRNQHLPFLFF